MGKLKVKIEIVCEDCGKKPKVNKEMSNENWIVTDNKPCKKCGGKLTLKVI